MRQTICKNGIPFEVMTESPNEETVKAIEEGRMLAYDKKADYITLKQFFEGYNGDHTPQEIDWGERAGEEIW